MFNRICFTLVVVLFSSSTFAVDGWTSVGKETIEVSASNATGAKLQLTTVRNEHSESGLGLFYIPANSKGCSLEGPVEKVFSVNGNPTVFSKFCFDEPTGMSMAYRPASYEEMKYMIASLVSPKPVDINGTKFSTVGFLELAETLLK